MSSGAGSPRMLASDDVDPLEDIAASTVAMIILFGSLMFATVSMMTRMFLLGDDRAIMAATTIKLKTPFAESSDIINPHHPESESDNASVNSRGGSTIVDDHIESFLSSNNSRKSSRSTQPHSVVSSSSVAHSRTNSSSNKGNTLMNIRMQETAFVQTFVLMYHMTLFGLVLLGVYLLDKYPPNGISSSATKNKVAVSSEPMQFNADQFLSWMILLIVYSCFASWQRNDGKSEEIKAQQKRKNSNIIERDDHADVQYTKTEDVSRRELQQSKRRPSRRADASTVGSGQSGVSKRMEDVLLEEVLGHDDDTIDHAFQNNRRDNKGWLERGLGMFGVDVREASRDGTLREWNPRDDVLNRLQTLEWKGFLSASLLVYQYCSRGRSGTYMAKAGANEQEDDTIGFLSPVWSNMEKVAFSCFLFVTGYSHTSYYYYHPDNIQKALTEHVPHCYDLSRVLGILFRWNWAAVFLSLALGNNILENYIVCTIHSFFFLSIWSILRFGHDINYDKYKFRLKIFMTICSVLLSDIMLTAIYNNNSVSGGFWEWRYLSHLHHAAPYVGTLFAINQPIASLQLRKIEALSLITSVLAKGSVFLTLVAATIFWAMGPLQSVSYDQTHIYFGALPLLAFVYGRNISHVLREHHNHFFSWIGQYSLEIFLLCRHMLYYEKFAIFIPGYPQLNFVVVCIVIVFLGRFLHNLTQIIVDFILPENDEQNSILQAGAFIAGLLALYTFAKLLAWANLVSVGSTVTIQIILGVLLYQIIMDMTWSEHQAISEGRNSSIDGPESSITKISVPISGVMSIFILTLGCYGWASCNGGDMTDGLRNIYVNRGFWLPISSCSVRGELNEGINYFGYEDCEEFIVGKKWVWPRESMSYGFRSRSGSDIKSSLLNKRVTFIGDSSVRSLFYSLCRFMGDHDAGGFEGLGAHADLRRLFPFANIEFKWSPLSVDIVSKLKGMRTTGISAGKPRPDLLVAGGGAWDKLHMAATDEDQQSHRDTITKLAFELNHLREQGIPVVWFVPPAINTPALNSDEKRVQMSEERLEETRDMYRELGVETSASFVLDGPSFTRERVADSFDGIDYPNDVYDAGIQILANAFDWLVEPSDAEDDSDILIPNADLQGNPYLSAQMLIFAMIGIFFFDAYFGLSYLAQIFVWKDKVAPSDLFQDAFARILARSSSSRFSGTPKNTELDELELVGQSPSGRSAYPIKSLSRRR